MRVVAVGMKPTVRRDRRAGMIGQIPDHGVLGLVNVSGMGRICSVFGQ